MVDDNRLLSDTVSEEEICNSDLTGNEILSVYFMIIKKSFISWV